MLCSAGTLGIHVHIVCRASCHSLMLLLRSSMLLPHSWWSRGELQINLKMSTGWLCHTQSTTVCTLHAVCVFCCRVRVLFQLVPHGYSKFCFLMHVIFFLCKPMEFIVMAAEEESGEPRSRIGFLPRCVDGRPVPCLGLLVFQFQLLAAGCRTRPCVLAVLGCLVGSLAFWAAHGGDPLTWKRPGSRLSELVQVWAPAADGKKLEPEVRDDGMLGIPFIESMPEETLPEYGHVKKEEVELGISQLAVARVDCWNPCDRKARCYSYVVDILCQAAACN